MSGITALTAYEINNHPDDLGIVIGQETKGGKYTFSISRGPGHCGKLLLTISPFAETVDEAAEEVKRILTVINNYVTQEMHAQSSILAKVACPGGQIDLSQTLNPALIEAITEKLRVSHAVSTHLMFTRDAQGNLKLK